MLPFSTKLKPRRSKLDAKGRLFYLCAQDYLTARWFVGAGEKSLLDIANVAGDEKHAEVIRFAVAILATDQRTEADERALRLITEVASKDAFLAAACLLEAARLQLSVDTAERIARQAWNDCAYLWRRHVHPRVASRLMWTLLSRVPRSDELLLEFLALEPGDRRRPMMGPEEMIGLLTSRPAGPVSDRLKWVLLQLTRNDHTDSWLALGSIAALILVEAGAAPAQAYLPALIRLLGHEHWPRDDRGSLSDRTVRLLRALDAAGGDSAQQVHRCLEAALTWGEALDDRGARVACAAAKLLIGLDAISEPDALEVLVQRGLRKEYSNDEALEDLAGFLKDEHLRPRAVKALVAGLDSANRSVRSGCAQVSNGPDLRNVIA